MFISIWFVVCLVVASFILLLPFAIWRREIRRRYSGSRLIACPKDHANAVVSIDLRRAAETEMDGIPDLRLSECTCWPERSECGQECMPQVLETAPYTPGKAQEPKQIYHLPVFAAAFAAWCVGAIWHSGYMFRPRWADAVGLTHTQVKQIVESLPPHLLTFAVCLLFAYGVAWLLALRHRKGVLQGLLMSVLLCGAVVATTWYGIAKLPHDLLVIEAGYLILATITVGAIVGGLYNKLATRSQ